MWAHYPNDKRTGDTCSQSDSAPVSELSLEAYPVLEAQTEANELPPATDGQGSTDGLVKDTKRSRVSPA